MFIIIIELVGLWELQLLNRIMSRCLFSKIRLPPSTETVPSKNTKQEKLTQSPFHQFEKAHYNFWLEDMEVFCSLLRSPQSWCTHDNKINHTLKCVDSLSAIVPTILCSSLVDYVSCTSHINLSDSIRLTCSDFCSWYCIHSQTM